MESVENYSASSVLDDFYDPQLNDFYDPQQEVYSLSLKLPISTRGRGKKITESDSDEDYDIDHSPQLCSYEYGKDLTHIDDNKEFELQEALRRAVGVGYSNEVIENHWNTKHINNEKAFEDSSEDSSVPAISTLPVDRNVRRRRTYQYMPGTATTNEEASISTSVERVKNTVEQDSSEKLQKFSKQCAANFSKPPPPEERKESQKTNVQQLDNTILSLDDELSILKLDSIHDSNPSVSVTDYCEYYDGYSSDENIIVDSKEIEVSSNDSANATSNNNQKINGKRKNRTKYKQLKDVEIKISKKNTSANSEFNRIPVETPITTKVTQLNPNAKEFVSQSYSYNFNNRNGGDRFEIASEYDFPSLK